MLLSTQALTLCNRAVEAVRAANPERADFLVLHLVSMALICNGNLFPLEFPMLAVEAS